MDVRRLGTNDAALLDAAMRAFRGFEQRADPAFLTDAANLAFVARDGETVVGWAWGHEFVRPDGGVVLVLLEIDVAQAVRREGVGKVLLEAFAESARSSGHTRTWLLTDAGVQAARAIYPAAGEPDEPLGSWWVFG